MDNIALILYSNAKKENGFTERLTIVAVALEIKTRSNP